MLEATESCEQISGKQLNLRYIAECRRGDHIWWISDISRFREHITTGAVDHCVWNYRPILGRIIRLRTCASLGVVLCVGAERYRRIAI